MKPKCPKCGSERIVEINTVYAEYPVLSIDPVTGEPEDYDAADVNWDTAERMDEPGPFTCDDCKHDFADFSHQVTP